MANIERWNYRISCAGVLESCLTMCSYAAAARRLQTD